MDPANQGIVDHKEQFITLEECIQQLKQESDINDPESHYISNHDLSIILGTDNKNRVVKRTLSDLNHIIIRGDAGTGKTCFLYNLLCSLMLRADDTINFVIMDTKKVGLEVFNKFSVLKTPVITGLDQSMYTIQWLLNEMEARFSELQRTKCKSIEKYNKKKIEQGAKKEIMPRIIAAIDELKSIHRYDSNALETALAQLTLRGRIAGIYIISVTETKDMYKKNLIKFPTRIKFMHGKVPLYTIGSSCIQGIIKINPPMLDINKMDKYVLEIASKYNL